MTLPREDFELHGFKCRAFRRANGGMFGIVFVRLHVGRRIEHGRYVELGGRRVYFTTVELDDVKYDGVIMSDNNDDIVAGFDPIDCMLRMDDVAKALRERVDRGESVP